MSATDIVPERVTGGCLCGAVRYAVTGPRRAITICHCGQCRRSMGLAGAFSAAPVAQVELPASEALGWYRSSEAAERGFCRLCGSTLFWKPSDGGHMSFTAGSLDDPAGLTIARHIFVADKAPYEVIPADLPSFPQDD